MNSPNPALVTERAAKRLPRPVLLLFCAAYVLPGLFGRDPWKSADASAFGYMINIAQGRTPWLDPTVGGLPGDAALLPYWLGAIFIKALSPAVDPMLAARLPFALLLVLVLVFTWYCTYHLARTEAAQPLPFAFGGEASPIDYARAIADGALLALIATLGLLQLGHETTPELAQLTATALFLYALAACPYRDTPARFAVLVALPALAASGAPAIALGLGIGGVIVCRASAYEQARALAPWVALSAVLSLVAAFALRAWGWRVAGYDSFAQVLGLLRQLVWFTWPAWPLALWTLWRWRDHLLHRHISIPLVCAGVGLAACLGMGGSDRALMLTLPALAVLVAFALPTLQRSTAAAIDWFSVFFFSVCAIAIWVVYVSMQTGVPRQPAANVARLAPGFVPSFSAFALIMAGAGTVAWLWLVQWRTGRNRHPLWKSMVLPASGVALCWLLLMTLWLPMLDYARSYRPLIVKLVPMLPKAGCVAAPGVSRAQVAALEDLGGYRVDAVTPARSTRCGVLLQIESRKRPVAAPAGWRRTGQANRPTDRDEVTAVYTRVSAGS